MPNKTESPEGHRHQTLLVYMLTQGIKQWCQASAIRTPFKTQMQLDTKQLFENL